MGVTRYEPPQSTNVTSTPAVEVTLRYQKPSSYKQPSDTCVRTFSTEGRVWGVVLPSSDGHQYVPLTRSWPYNKTPQTSLKEITSKILTDPNQFNFIPSQYQSHLGVLKTVASQNPNILYKHETHRGSLNHQDVLIAAVQRDCDVLKWNIPILNRFRANKNNVGSLQTRFFDSPEKLGDAYKVAIAALRCTVIDGSEGCFEFPQEDLPLIDKAYNEGTESLQKTLKNLGERNPSYNNLRAGAITRHNGRYLFGHAFPAMTKMPTFLSNNIHVMKEAIKINPLCYKSIVSSHLNMNTLERIAKNLIPVNPDVIQYMDRIRTKKKYALMAVRQSGTAIKWLPDNLKDNLDVAVAALEQNSEASNHMKKDVFEKASKRIKKKEEQKAWDSSFLGRITNILICILQSNS